eukprot:tig00021374_g21128.t1
MSPSSSGFTSGSGLPGCWARDEEWLRDLFTCAVLCEAAYEPPHRVAATIATLGAGLLCRPLRLHRSSARAFQHTLSADDGETLYFVLRGSAEGRCWAVNAAADPAPDPDLGLGASFAGRAERAPLEAVVDAAARLGRRLVLAGHSMGGAVACLLLARLLAAAEARPGGPHARAARGARCFTFGQPLYASGDPAARFPTWPERLFPFAAEGDPVPVSHLLAQRVAPGVLGAGGLPFRPHHRTWVLGASGPVLRIVPAAAYDGAAFLRAVPGDVHRIQENHSLANYTRLLLRMAGRGGATAAPQATPSFTPGKIALPPRPRSAVLELEVQTGLLVALVRGYGLGRVTSARLRHEGYWVDATRKGLDEDGGALFLAFHVPPGRGARTRATLRLDSDFGRASVPARVRFPRVVIVAAGDGAAAALAEGAVRLLSDPEAGPGPGPAPAWTRAGTLRARFLEVEPASVAGGARLRRALGRAPSPLLVFQCAPGPQPVAPGLQLPVYPLLAAGPELQARAIAGAISAASGRPRGRPAPSPLAPAEVEAGEALACGLVQRALAAVARGGARARVSVSFAGLATITFGLSVGLRLDLAGAR